MQKRIYIAYTGGTLGMQPSAQGYVPMRGFADLLARKLHGHGPLPDYELCEYEQLIDSANITPAHWQRIGQDLIDRYEQFDGFVVLHGTDTMAYTAAALSFMLQGLGKPVIVTGSQIPLCELRNDAQDNLVTAMLLASQYDIPEVCIYFNGRLLRGNRASKVKATGFDAFDSPNYPWLGQVGIHIELNTAALRASSGPTAFQAPLYAAGSVLPLRVFPGLRATWLAAALQPEVRGLILDSYGVGNAPDQDPELCQVLEAAVARGVVVVNRSQCLQGRVDQSAYATGSALARLGVISGGDMTLEAAFTKLHHLLAQGLEPAAIRAQMQRDLCGELST